MRWTRVEFGQLADVYPYLAHRHNSFVTHREFPDLPVPDEFQGIFNDWADGKVNLIAASRL